MLLQFVVENHLSFRDAATLSMLAPDGAEPATLRCAALYGANASGKSNLVRALQFFVGLTTKGVKVGEAIGVNPFRLRAESRSRPTRFQVDLELAEGRFAYGLAVANDAVVEEWLTRGECVVFERTAQDGISVGDTVGDRELWGFVARSTRPEQLFIYEAADKNLAEVGPLARWLRAVRFVSPRGAATGRLVATLQENEAFRDYSTRLLARLGTGVRELEIEKQALRPETTDLANLAKALMDGAIGPTDVEVDLQRETLRRLWFAHEGEDASVRFAPSEESDGTRRLLELAPIPYAAQLDGSSPLFVVDELDRSLHPLLSRELVREFHEATRAHARSPQLVFTTHDTSLLAADVLEPASVWFTEKDRGGATSLYSLAEFKGEQLAQLTSSLERGYLNGRFGAIPFIAGGDRFKVSKP